MKGCTVHPSETKDERFNFFNPEKFDINRFRISFANNFHLIIQIHMKAKYWFFGLASLLLPLATGCDKSDLETDYLEWDETTYLTKDVLYPKNSKLKRVIETNEDHTFSRVLKEYEYDTAGRIAKVIFTSVDMYDRYEYNENGQLSSISKYSGSTLKQLTVYTYDRDGNRTEEQTTDTETGVISSSILYEYQNGRLVKSAHYTWYAAMESDSRFVREYEYNSSGELVKEWLSVPEEDGFAVTEHFYRDGLRFYSVTYSGDDRKSGFASDLKRIYDVNGNLVMTIDDVPGLSSNSFSEHFYLICVYEY
jgi:hypothetical protein